MDKLAMIGSATGRGGNVSAHSPDGDVQWWQVATSSRSGQNAKDAAGAAHNQEAVIA